VLTSSLSALPALPPVSIPNPLSGILGGPATLTTPTLDGSLLSSAVNDVPAQVTALTDKLLNGAAVDLNGVDTAQAITPGTSAVTAAAHSSLLSADLFGGLVHVTATQAAASAKAGLTKAAAASTGSATLVSVRVSDAFGTLLQAVASDKGITAGLLDGSLGQALDSVTQPIVATVDAALGTVLSELTGLLSSLNSGASVLQQGTLTKKVSADGHSAEAHATPAAVRVGLPVAPDLLTLTIGKADAVSAVSVAAPTVVTPVTAPPQELPHTGLSDDATLLALGLLLAAGTTVALRRRTAGSPH
jgi:LPXTG-motif cell wall-anchored protein